MVNVKRRLLIYSIVAGIFTGIFEGIALGNYGVFQDTAVYYDLYKNINQYGVYQTAIDFSGLTKKNEPILLILFYIESLIGLNNINENSFLIINIVLLNTLLAFVVIKYYFSNNKLRPIYIIIFIITALLSYQSFSKMLYVWRSILAFIFFIISINSNGYKKVLWICITCFTHITFAPFIGLYLAIEKVSSEKKWCLLYIMAILMPIFIIFVQVNPEFFSSFVVGGDVEVFLSEGDGHSLFSYAAIFYTTILLLMGCREYFHSPALRNIYIFSLMTSLASLFAYNTDQLMNRIILPVFLISSFLPFMIKSNSKYILLSRIGVFLSVIPSIRLIYLLYTGEFLK